MNEVDSNGNVVQLNSISVSTSETVQSPAVTASARRDGVSTAPSSAPEADAEAPQKASDAPADLNNPPGYVQLLSGLDKLLSSEAVAAVQHFLEAVEAYERSWAEVDAQNEATTTAEKSSNAERVKPPQPIMFEVSSNKDERTAVHHFFKQPGLPKCSTETVPASEEGQNSMRLCYHAQVGYMQHLEAQCNRLCERQRTYAFRPQLCCVLHCM